MSDRKFFDDTDDSYFAEVKTATDYYPFGMAMPGRDFSSGDYRFGFNGIEKNGEGELGKESYSTLFRQYNPVIGRWMSRDPKSTAFTSDYVFSTNSPIFKNDPMGDTTRIFNISGDFQYKIDDSFDNEEHFLDDSALSDLGCVSDGCSESGGDNSDFLGKKARAISKFYMGKNTRKDIKGLVKDSNSIFKENGGVLAISKDSKEIRIIKCENCVGVGTTISGIWDGTRYRNKFGVSTIAEGHIVVGTYHSHPIGEKDGNKFFYAGENEFKSSAGADWYDNRNINGKPFYRTKTWFNLSNGLEVIGHSKGATIYTAHKVNIIKYNPQSGKYIETTDQARSSDRNDKIINFK